MLYAIFSDIHNNAKALRAVLKHAQQQQVEGYFCLGDVGDDDCVALVRDVAAPTVFGNWETDHWRYLSPENEDWALALPVTIRQEGFWLTHAAPLWPMSLATLADFEANPYLVPHSILFPYLHNNQEALWQSIAMLTAAKVPVLFHGHTHRQMIWQFSHDNQLRQNQQKRVTLTAGNTFVIGVGSVSRPQDGPGAAYVIFDTSAGEVELVRL